MRKDDYLEMLVQDLNGKDEKIPYVDVIECVYLALSETSSDFEVDESISLEKLYGLIYNKAKEENLRCVGPFVVAEMFAGLFKAEYIRPSKKLGIAKVRRQIVDFNDFI